MIASHHRKQPKKRCRVTGKGFGVIIAATVMWLAGCAQTTTAPQSAAALALASSEPPAFQVKSTAQVQPVAPMPAAASARARQLIATWKSIKSTTDPTLPHDLFGEPSSVTVSYAHRNADGTLNYSWTARSAGPTQECGSYYFPSFLETADAVVVYIADRYGPNASPSDMCAATGKEYSVRLPLQSPLGHRVIIDVGLGTVVPLN